MPTVRIATRGSTQARTQATAVGEELVRRAPGTTVEYVLVETTGDANQTTPLHQMGGQGVFVKEVQRAVLEGRADLAVHSAKDLPSVATDGLSIVAYTERRSANDVLVGSSLSALAPGATVATGSVRRRAQLARVRSDLRFAELRGNIETRLSRVPDGGAIVMARAALEILGLTHLVAEDLDLDTAVPMVGQGCVAVEARSSDSSTTQAVSVLDHAATRRAVETERAFLAELGAGCTLPVGAHLSTDGVFRAFMAGNGETVQVSGNVGSSDDHLMIGRATADRCRALLAGRDADG